MSARLQHQKGDWSKTGDLARVLCGARGRRAGDYHDAVMIILDREGWKAEREFTVPDGRIDVIAMKESATGLVMLCLELDNRSPRKRSIKKLASLPDGWLSGVLLRNPK